MRKKVVVQSVLIDKSLVSSATDARKIVRSMGMKSAKIDTTDKYYRFRQETPSGCKKGSFRIKKVNNRIDFIFCKKK